MSPLASKKLINPFHKLFLSRQDLQYSSPIKPTSAVLALHPEKESIYHKYPERSNTII